MDFKICTKCKAEKTFDEFSRNRTKKDGYESWCKECGKEYKKRYRKSDRGKKVEEAYRIKNKDKYKEIQSKYEKNRRLSADRQDYLKEYREKNKERLRKLRRIWGKENLDKISVYNHARMTKAKNLRYEWGKQERDFVIGFFGNKCALTGDEGNLELDHFIALSTGFGGTYIGNMIPLKAEINNSKHNKNPFEWIQSQTEEMKKNFSFVVEVLAEQNNMDVREFELYVNSCYKSGKQSIL